jgi:uncharacterized protein YbjT (DUF2867 family)
MHVLIVGASGFIGRHLAARLVAGGVRVTAAGRAPDRLQRFLPDAAAMRCDLTADDADDWRERLVGVANSMSARSTASPSLRAGPSATRPSILAACSRQSRGCGIWPASAWTN